MLIKILSPSTLPESTSYADYPNTNIRIRTMSEQ